MPLRMPALIWPRDVAKRGIKTKDPRQSMLS
ncbi:msr9326 (plasmid) [Mesorhizobium japonicum MAFF 303099]|uniref:Msr9326 protein n=1 Tax=Mesorhizobium japonicum (strain LMG 29417 / CECT 9101 / MAFF 303099) TaxID=266835 RepID=Q981L4_RHILO|nr:msr9326 [Mesorhizobium japonicum MAFF 303099]